MEKKGDETNLKTEPSLKIIPIKKTKIKDKSKIKKNLVILTKIKSIYILHKPKLLFIGRVLVFAIAYGLPINYMLWSIFKINFGIFTFPAYGLAFHFLKDELPIIFRRYIPDKKQ